MTLASFTLTIMISFVISFWRPFIYEEYRDERKARAAYAEYLVRYPNAEIQLYKEEL